MKVMSYVCKQAEIKEKRDWLLGMGLNVFRQTQLIDVESAIPEGLCMFTFFVPNKEIETFLTLTYPEGTFRDCSA